MNGQSLCDESATQLTRRLRSGDLSAVELMQATLERIDALNPALNAIVTLVPERALAQARQADDRRAAGEPLGPLHGLPIAHKDLVQTAGIRSTSGSTLLADHIPERDDLIVERIRDAGAICIGKTNTPEFGAGSQTYNEVFGETKNPYDTTRTCGGSSGGAAVALASGMLAIADGSDMGGSLRNPASFCNVVGMRPSAGRVPSVPALMGSETLSVLGPMARNVADAALLLSAIAGPDSRSPISIPEDGSRFAAPLERDFRGTRIAWSPDLGGLPIDPAVRVALERGPADLARLGCEVEASDPPLEHADEIFKLLRAWTFAMKFQTLPAHAFATLKDTIQWNIEEGRKLSAADIGRAEILRTKLFTRMHTFMQTYEFLVLPVSQVPPFDLKSRWVEEIDGTQMATYIDWMRSCYFITATGHPAISVPCGFTQDGLPVGLQIVGRYRDDFGVLQLAHAFERANGAGERRPPR